MHEALNEPVTMGYFIIYVLLSAAAQIGAVFIKHGAHRRRLWRRGHHADD
jgi:hypothetical protein